MRWMKREPIIQSEVSQKDKHQYSILMHIYGMFFWIAPLATHHRWRGGLDLSKQPNLSRDTFFFPFIFIIWRLITLQYCSGFCHTLTWISHGFTCVPHPSGSSQCTRPEHCMHPTWAGDCFTLDSILVSMLFSLNIPPLPSPTESKSLFCTSVSLL